MTVIKRSAILPYTTRQMFELVDNIEDYPRFLPWCDKSTILHRDEKMVEATLELQWSHMRKSFTTRNQLTPYEQIEISLVHGPFRHLEGIWRFQSLGENGCKIDLKLEFEFTGHFLDKLFQPIFHKMANSLVELFSKRAVEVYGPKARN
jgi:ribosome-associated toxin RatA of RatAB toxin-antitoxin module